MMHLLSQTFPQRFAQSFASSIPQNPDRVKNPHTAGGPKDIQIAYGADGSTLWYWQLRDFPNAVSYGEAPSREQMEFPVVIAGRDQWEEVTPYMDRDYTVNTYTYLWWPMEDYRNLTWADEWPLRSDYRLYIRRDMAGQVLHPLTGTPPQPAVCLEHPKHASGDLVHLAAQLCQHLFQRQRHRLDLLAEVLQSLVFHLGQACTGFRLVLQVQEFHLVLPLPAVRLPLCLGAPKVGQSLYPTQRYGCRKATSTLTAFSPSRARWAALRNHSGISRGTRSFGGRR